MKDLFMFRKFNKNKFGRPFEYNVKRPKQHPLYVRWRDIKQWINNPNHECYKTIGGKGIKMFPEWDKNFKLFLIWCLQNGYKKDHLLTRKDKNKDYEPSNCLFIKHPYEK